MPGSSSELSAPHYERLGEIIAATADPGTKLLQLRQLLESIYKQLSSDSGISFSGLFARMQYVHAQTNPPQELVNQLNQLRILCNKVAHEGDKPGLEAYLSGILALRDTLRWLDPESGTGEVDEYLRQNQARSFPALEHIPKQSFNCVVLGWELLRQAGKDSGIEIRASDEEGNVLTLMLNDRAGDGSRWSALAKVLWEYCTLNCLNLTPIKGRDRSYSSNPLTMIVVEPDFLIDASSVAECFTNQETHPEYYLLSRLLREPGSSSTVKGNMVNNILDELISEPDNGYQILFQRSLAKMPISLAAIGKEAALELYAAIRDVHFPPLQSFAASVGQDPIQLEPSYICPEYGLQGRLDILYTSAGKQYIVELKSGSAPRYDVWKLHQMQVVAYNMILRRCVEKDALGTSSILYSAAPENHLRHVVNTLELELALLMARNRIVGIMHGLAVDPSVFFNWLLGRQASSGADFRLAQIQTIVSTLKALPEHEYEWFLGQLRLLVREIWFAKTGGLGRDSIYGHNGLWQESTAVKQERYRLLGELRIASVSFNTIVFSLSGEEKVTDFREDDIVVLYRQNLAVSRQQILRGQIVRLSGDSVEVLIRGGLRHFPEPFMQDLWALEHDILETSLFNPLAAIFSFLRGDSKKRQLWLGLAKPGYTAEIPEGAELADTIARMQSSEDYHIVQGPPGTGKTSGLLTAYISALYRDTSKNILILSFTNRAVDEICLNLKRNSIPFIRTGHSSEVTEELLDKQIQGQKYDVISRIVASNRVWVATVSSCSAWLPDLVKLIKFDELVIDEASQIVENSILGIIVQADKTILIGDQNQLPPISRQADQGFAYTHPQLTGLCYDSYSQSLMERLNRVCRSQAWNHASTMLRQHYRMHDAIAGLIQPYYQNSLISMQPRQRLALSPNVEPLLSSRLVWIDFPPSRHHFYDPLQVQGILYLLELLASKGIVADTATEIGIVAPFRAMIHALLHELPAELQSLTIDTVERFQGSERGIIIITLPLHSAGALRNIEALAADGSVDRKLNVAVSRAMERVFVLGCAEICQASAHYKLLVDKIRASGKMLHYSDILKE